MIQRRYERYKDSGVDWLGEVPAHWDITRLRYLCDIQTGSRDTENADEDGQYDFFVRSQTIERIDSYSHECEAILTAGDGAGVGKVFHHTNGRFDFHQRVYMLNNFRGISGRYLFHFIREFFHRVALDGGAKSTVDSLRRPQFLNFWVAVPSVAEQAAIATFLDQETTKIDALVAEQQQLIALLAEKRQAVISHAVTKGLDPYAPMKESGVEWLGLVPTHWNVSRLKFLATVQTGIAKGKNYADKPTVIVPYLRVANVQDGYLDLDEIATIDIPSEDIPRYSLRIGDVLMNEGGDFDKLGRGHIWNGELEQCIHQNHVFAVRPTLVSPAWLNTLTGSSYAQYYFMGRSKQSTNLASISSTNIMELPVLCPPEHEQHTIATFVEHETAKIDALIAEANRAIELLQERRTALISAAVTGKIDVSSEQREAAIGKIDTRVLA